MVKIMTLINCVICNSISTNPKHYRKLAFPKSQIRGKFFESLCLRSYHISVLRHKYLRPSENVIVHLKTILLICLASTASYMAPQQRKTKNKTKLN